MKNRACTVFFACVLAAVTPAVAVAGDDGCAANTLRDFAESKRGEFGPDSIRDGHPLSTSALENAVIFDYADLVRKLLGDKRIVQRDGANALYGATSLGRRNQMRLLISAGVSPNASESYPPPIEAAIHSGCVEEFKLLIELGADVNIRFDSGGGLIFLAVTERHYALAAMLPRYGYRADANEIGLVRRMLERRGEMGVYHDIFGE